MTAARVSRRDAAIRGRETTAIKIAHADEAECKRGLQHRRGTFHYRHLLDGRPGTPGSFQFNIGQIEGDFVSPRVLPDLAGIAARRPVQVEAAE